MFKITFGPLDINDEYDIRWLENQGHDTLKLLNEQLLIHYKYTSPRVGLSAILHELYFTYSIN